MNLNDKNKSSSCFKKKEKVFFDYKNKVNDYFEQINENNFLEYHQKILLLAKKATTKFQSAGWLLLADSYDRFAQIIKNFYQLQITIPEHIQGLSQGKTKKNLKHTIIPEHIQGVSQEKTKKNLTHSYLDDPLFHYYIKKSFIAWYVAGILKAVSIENLSKAELEIPENFLEHLNQLLRDISFLTMLEKNNILKKAQSIINKLSLM